MRCWRNDEESDFQISDFVPAQAIHFSNAKRAIPSPEGGRNGAFRGKY